MRQTASERRSVVITHERHTFESSASTWPHTLRAVRGTRVSLNGYNAPRVQVQPASPILSNHSVKEALYDFADAAYELFLVSQSDPDTEKETAATQRHDTAFAELSRLIEASR